jgi:hypothetical protein
VVRRRFRVGVSCQAVQIPYSCPTRGTGKNKGTSATFTIAPITTSLMLQLTLFMPDQLLGKPSHSPQRVRLRRRLRSNPKSVPLVSEKPYLGSARNDGPHNCPALPKYDKPCFSPQLLRNCAGRPPHQASNPDWVVRTLHPVMILPQVHLRKPCYDFYFL